MPPLADIAQRATVTGLAGLGVSKQPGDEDQKRLFTRSIIHSPPDLGPLAHRCRMEEQEGRRSGKWSSWLTPSAAPAQRRADLKDVPTILTVPK